jgi:hypothetical protein
VVEHTTADTAAASGSDASGNVLSGIGVGG